MSLRHQYRILTFYWRRRVFGIGLLELIMSFIADILSYRYFGFSIPIGLSYGFTFVWLSVHLYVYVLVIFFRNRSLDFLDFLHDAKGQ